MKQLMKSSMEIVGISITPFLNLTTRKLSSATLPCRRLIQARRSLETHWITCVAAAGVRCLFSCGSFGIKLDLRKSSKCFPCRVWHWAMTSSGLWMALLKKSIASLAREGPDSSPDITERSNKRGRIKKGI
ncbi:hypothetical protein CsSME_00016808 [Camellia sinensis var. sinensis]